MALSRSPTPNRSPWGALCNSLSSICRRVHNGSQTPHRFAPPAFPPIPLLQQLAPCRGGLCIQGPGPAHGEQCHCAVYGCQNPTVRGPCWGGSRGSFVRNALSVIYSPPLPGDSCEDSLQVRDEGKLQDVPVCVRQMCHIWMLCELGYICPSRICSPILLSRTWWRSLQEERSLLCTDDQQWSKPYPILSGQGSQGKERQWSPRTGLLRFLLIPLFPSPGSEVR